jgi:pimeloyl-ACP methyl ester carboxylesterase
MASFTSGGVSLAYDDITPPGGAARTVLLLHGFASNRNEGWRRTGWYGAFERRGVRVVGLDQRGHGESAKLYDPEAYAREKLAGDVLALMDHLDLGRVDLFGYSMGTRTALQAAIDAPDRISNLILGGVGGRLLEPSPQDRTGLMVDAMLADDPASIQQPMLQSFRHFADEQGEDRLALAACSRARSTPISRDDLFAISVPTLVAAGARDELAGDPHGLADAIRGAKAITLAGCDHFNAIPHALLKAAVFDFLDGYLDEPFG